MSEPREPSGPDPDNPPWAGRQRPHADTDADTDPGAAGEGEDADTTEDATEGVGADATEAPQGAGEAAASDDGDDGTQQSLEHLRDVPLPRAPRRTGVFLDPEDLREHVGGLLRVMLGGYQVDAWGNFTFTHDSARIFVTVGGSPIGPQVGVFSVTNLDVELTPELATFLVTTNHRLGFGSFSYDPESSAVWLRHTLLGTTLDGPELQAAVAAVASTAAAVDDQIAARFGGRTFNEAPADVQEATKPPETSQAAYPPGYL